MSGSGVLGSARLATGPEALAAAKRLQAGPRLALGWVRVPKCRKNDREWHALEWPTSKHVLIIGGTRGGKGDADNPAPAPPPGGAFVLTPSADGMLTMVALWTRTVVLHRRWWGGGSDGRVVHGSSPGEESRLSVSSVLPW